MIYDSKHDSVYAKPTEHFDKRVEMNKNTRFSEPSEIRDQKQKNRNSNLSFAPDSDDASEASEYSSPKPRSRLSRTWKKCRDSFTGAGTRENVFSMVCSRILKTENGSAEEDAWVVTDDDLPEYEPSRSIENNARARKVSMEAVKTGHRQKFTQSLKNRSSALGSFFLGKSHRGRAHGYSQIVFDQFYDLKWQLGYCPDVYITTASPGTATLEKLGRGVTYTRRMPYGTSALWSNESSAPVNCYTGLMTSDPASTPVDVASLMEKFKGLEPIYITDEAHFFIDNSGNQSAKPEKSNLTRLVSSILHKASPRACNSARARLIDRMNTMLRADQQGKTNDATNPESGSFRPPSVNEITVLKPLSLVKRSKWLISRLGSGRNEDETQKAPEHAQAMSMSPSLQGVLRDLKLVRRRGDSKNYFRVPVWSNLANSRARLSEVPARARPVGLVFDKDTEVFI